jgi:hypothetical protein
MSSCLSLSTKSINRISDGVGKHIIHEISSITGRIYVVLEKMCNEYIHMIFMISKIDIYSYQIDGIIIVDK